MTIYRAMEYGVRAQETLNRMQKRHSEELSLLHERYQQTLNKMIRETDSNEAQNNNIRGGVEQQLSN